MNEIEKNSDFELVAQLKSGNIRAYGILFEKYGKKLYYFALGYLKSPIEAEGLVQDVFTKIWEKKEDLKPECSFKSYIFTIAFNFIKKIFIKREKFRNYLSDVKDNQNIDFSTSDQIDYNSLMENLTILVGQMPERRKETFVKSRFEGLSVKEIAIEMRISTKTVENQLTSALKFVKNGWNVEGFGQHYL